MMMVVLGGIMLPFWGTALGAGGVFFLRGCQREGLRRALCGLAAGIMTAASVWSLLLPAIERSAGWGRLAFAPAALGLWAGTLFIAALDGACRRLCARYAREDAAGTALMILAVTLHNLPEGMAVGAAWTGCLAGDGGTAAALALTLGIAIQNLPEGAIVSMPLRAEGMGRGRSFLYGALSGAVEPVGAAAVLAAAKLIVPVLPWFLGFAAGAMLCVVVRELIPSLRGGDGDMTGPVLFAAGFTIMLALDAAL